jgi:hypothetical protein
MSCQQQEASQLHNVLLSQHEIKGNEFQFVSQEICMNRE